jgi:hypothetical protein
MKRGDDSDFSSQVFRVSAQFEQRLGSRSEQNVVQNSLVGQRQWVQHVGNGEDRMKIDDAKHLLFSGQYPFFSGQCAAFGAVTVPAGVVKRPLVSALIAAVQSSPKTGRPALDNGVHGFVRL